VAVIYVAAGIVGFVAFIVAAWAVIGWVAPTMSYETGLLYLYVAALVGLVVSPLLLWRYRRRKLRNVQPK
jgi:sugar phosphate permease